VPVTVTDAGEFVPVTVRKVDAADPSVVLPGATFDLYRVDGGNGPGTVPTPPPDAPIEGGETCVARATNEGTGVASFPLQFPGYGYCVVEHQAPANYVADSTPRCTGVLTGTTVTPAPVVTVTVADTDATVALSSHKFN
jgi:uncharacterized surface anchored protein